jgi:hypothetical protein
VFALAVANCEKFFHFSVLSIKNWHTLLFLGLSLKKLCGNSNCIPILQLASSVSLPPLSTAFELKDRDEFGGDLGPVERRQEGERHGTRRGQDRRRLRVKAKD